MLDLPEGPVTSAKAREHFAELLDRAAEHKERVVLTRRGRPIAAVIPIEDLRWLEAIENLLDAEEFRRAKEEFERSGEPAIPWERIKGELGL